MSSPAVTEDAMMFWKKSFLLTPEQEALAQRQKLLNQVRKAAIEARAAAQGKWSLKRFGIYENGTCYYLDGDGWQIFKNHPSALMYSGATLQLVPTATSQVGDGLVSAINLAHPNFAVLRTLKCGAWLELEFVEQGVDPEFNATHPASYLIFKPKKGRNYSGVTRH